MRTPEPGIEEVEKAIAELLCEQEIGALAVRGPADAPAVSMMHFASDGLLVYIHTFTTTRKFVSMNDDPRVSYTIAHLPAEGYAGRGDARAIQVEGIASPVSDPAEIDRAIEVSHQQFEWLSDLALYDTFKKGTAHHQRFFRIDPVTATWNDNRVRLQWRKLVTFTDDGQHVASLTPYGRRTAHEDAEDSS